VLALVELYMINVMLPLVTNHCRLNKLCMLPFILPKVYCEKPPNIQNIVISVSHNIFLHQIEIFENFSTS